MLLHSGEFGEVWELGGRRILVQADHAIIDGQPFGIHEFRAYKRKCLNPTAREQQCEENQKTDS